MSRVKIAEKTVFLFYFQSFFELWAKIIQTFGQKTSRICQNYLLRVQRKNLWLFFKFWNVSDFLQKHLAWFPIFYLRVQSKNCGKNSFFCIFPEFFRILSKIFSDFRPNNIKKISKLPTCPEEKFVTWNFFLNFWIVLDFLQKPSAWFSNFYLRVQSKNCGKNSFFVLFSEFFRIMSENNSDFWPKNFKNLSKLPSTCPEEEFVAFFKFWNVSDFLQKHLAWFPIFYLRVQSKNCGKNSFFLYFSRIFSNFEQNFFRLSAKQHQKDFKTTYVSRGKVCDLKFFSKVLNRFGFSAETFGMVLKLLSTCPE